MKSQIDKRKAIKTIIEHVYATPVPTTKQESQQLENDIASILDTRSYRDNDLEIHHMLTLSTAHIDQTTRDLLTRTARNEGLDTVQIPVYEKDGYGWFIPVDNHIPPGTTRPLTVCIMATLMAGCDWLCLDADGPTVDEIPIYE